MENIKLAVIGLGYVGLPLARLFATRYPVVGYDVKRERVAALMEGRDATQEVSDELLRSVLLPRLPEEGEAGLFCTSDAEQLRGCNYYIVAVPTPVDLHHSPDLTPLYSASETVGKVLGRGDIVIYESTVCPGITTNVFPFWRERPDWFLTAISLPDIRRSVLIRETRNIRWRRL